MKLEIIRGAAGPGKTTKLQEILRNAEDKGSQAVSILGYTTLVVERKLRQLVADGFTTIVIADCSDIEMLKKICRANHAEGVTVYAVEAA